MDKLIVMSVTVFVLITVHRFRDYNDPSVRFAIKVEPNLRVAAGGSIFRADRVEFKYVLTDFCG